MVNKEVPNQLIPPIEDSVTVRCGTYSPLIYIVVEVPSDSEIYVFKRLVHPSEISPVILRSLSTIPNCQRAVYIKSAAKVRYETLDLIVTAARHSGIDRIEFVLDKKKRTRLRDTVPPNKSLERIRL